MFEKKRTERKTSETQTKAPRLALRPKEAAKALGIGERLLWSKTNSGEIPHVRIGRAVVYPIHTLREWLANNTSRHGR